MVGAGGGRMFKPFDGIIIVSVLLTNRTPPCDPIGVYCHNASRRMVHTGARAWIIYAVIKVLPDPNLRSTPFAVRTVGSPGLCERARAGHENKAENQEKSHQLRELFHVQRSFSMVKFDMCAVLNLRSVGLDALFAVGRLRALLCVGRLSAFLLLVYLMS